MRLPWTALVLVGFSLFATPRANAGTIYKIEFFQPAREVGQLELTFEGAKISGQLQPLRGYPHHVVPVTGTNTADGVLELTFQFPKRLTATFKKSLSEDTITWTQTDQAYSQFWRPRSGEFSQAALTLERPGDCGLIYRSLKVAFAEGTSKERLARFLSGNPDLAELPVTIDVNLPTRPDLLSRELLSRRPRRLPLGAALPELLQRRLLQRETVDREFELEFDVPVGTEVTVATALRRSGFMGANLAGVCGEGEEAFFVLDRSLIFDGSAFAKDKLVALLDQGLNAFAGRDRSGRTFDYTIGNGAVSTLKIAPFSSSYRVRMRVASEVSRQVAGNWDSFDVLFEPVELIVDTQQEYSVVVTVENLQSTDRATGRAAAFKDFDVGLATAEIEATLLAFLAQQVKDGWCEFTAGDVDESKAKCDGRSRRRLRAWRGY